MILRRLDRKAEAGRPLAASTKALRATTFDGGNRWHDWLTSDLFCREAEALIRGTSIPATADKASKASEAGTTQPSIPAPSVKQ
jgi:hypothetical protein